jgi:hypothetical protein
MGVQKVSHFLTECVLLNVDIMEHLLFLRRMLSVFVKLLGMDAFVIDSLVGEWLRKNMKDDGEMQATSVNVTSTYQEITVM